MDWRVFACVLALVLAGCAGPGTQPTDTATARTATSPATEAPTASPSATRPRTRSDPGGSATPGSTTASSPPVKTTQRPVNETRIVLANEADDEVAYAVDVTLFAEPFERARITYANGTTREYDVSTARALKARAQLMRATDAEIDGGSAQSVTLDATPGATAEATLAGVPRGATLLYLLYEREDPDSTTHWSGLYRCESGDFGPVRFTLSADGGQSFEPGCFYDTPI